MPTMVVSKVTSDVWAVTKGQAFRVKSIISGNSEFYYVVVDLEMNCIRSIPTVLFEDV